MKKRIDVVYVETYFSHLTDEDAIKNEKKKVKNLISKLQNSKSVFKQLPFEYLNIKEKVKLLHFILEEIDEREIISNLEKINVDKVYTNIEMFDETEEHTDYFLGEDIIEYESLDIKGMLFLNRNIIRGEKNNKLVLDDLKKNNEAIYDYIIKEINMFYAMGLYFEDISYIKDYADCIINDIMQLVIYRVIVKESNETHFVLQELVSEIKRISAEIDEQLKEKYDKKESMESLTARQVTHYFSLYLSHRSKLKTEIDIYTTLEREIRENTSMFETVSDEYRAEKVLLSDEEINKAKTIITEGQNIYRYEEKMTLVREFIDIMNVYGGRDCYSNCLQDLKVYFREIYISKITYKRQQARKIVEDYVKKVQMAKEGNIEVPAFDKQSQYMFVREKISRGYFREKGKIVDYLDKIEITNELYELILKSYYFYDFFDGVTILYEVERKLLEKMAKLL